MAVENYDSAIIQKKIKDIKDKAEQRLQEITNINTTIQDLNKKKTEVYHERKLEAVASLDALAKEFPFTKIVQNKVNELQETYELALQTMDDIKALYQKAFNKLSTRRIIVKPETIGLQPYQGNNQYLLLLTPRGFCWAYKYNYNPTEECGPNNVSKGYPVEDIESIRNIFNCPDVKQSIQKNDKYEMFDAFAEAFSNFMVPWEFIISNNYIFDNLNIAYPKFKSYDYSDEFTFSMESITALTLEIKPLYEQVQCNIYLRTQFGSETRYNIMDASALNFGELVVMASVWDRMETEINTMIRKMKSIIDNNKSVIDTLRRKIAVHIVAEDL